MFVLLRFQASKLYINLQMYSHQPLQPNFIINPPLYKHNHSFSATRVVQQLTQQHQRCFNQPHGLPNYNFHPRASSSFNSRMPSQNQIILPTKDPTFQTHHLRYESSKKIEGFGQQKQRKQLLQPQQLNSNKQTEIDSTKQISNNSSVNSNSKKVHPKSFIFPDCLQTNKDIKCIIEMKIQPFPKNTFLPQTNSVCFQENKELNLPLNDTDCRIQTDRNIMGHREPTLISKMPIPNNSSQKIQTKQPQSKEKMQYKELESTSNSFKNIFIAQEKSVVQIGNKHKIKKSMTQASFWRMSYSPSKQNKPKLPLFQKFSVTKQEKEPDKKNVSIELKNKSSFEFFKDIKKKRLISSSQPLQKQFQLSDFELMDKLGKGAFGDVFLAQEKLSGFMCVIKKLSKKKLKEHKLQQQLFRQIKIQSYLHHRHLTSLYGFFCDQNYIYLILELLPDGSMMQVKKKRKIPENQVSTYVRQISLGLKYMHTQRVIHRDIKPQNIFLYEGYAKIGDFGCSIYTHTNRSTQIGSLAYLSPQQLKQQAYNQKIDVWSLGVMAYQMLMGVSPFQQDIIKIAKKQIGPQLSELKFCDKVSLSQEAKDFLTGMLNTDPQKRFGIHQALRHEFIVKYVRQEQSKLQKLMR